MDSFNIISTEFFNHPCPAVISTQGHNKGHREHRVTHLYFLLCALGVL